VWALVIAIACELPSRLGLPLSRHFASNVWRVVRDQDVTISLRTVQRMLARHHLKPWRYVSWMHPRDPHFIEKTRVILDLYAGFWEFRLTPSATGTNLRRVSRWWPSGPIGFVMLRVHRKRHAPRKNQVSLVRIKAVLEAERLAA
jgi:hypothetical protein